MKAPFAYYGGKSGMAAAIVDLLPPHRTYMEPFFGSGAVLFAKKPAVMEIVNDADDAVVTFFRVLRERPDELEQVCRLTPYARSEYEAADVDAEDLDDLELARRFWVRVNQSFAKTAGRRTGWSVTVARTQSPPNSTLGRIGRFQACAERLAQVSIENCDAVALVERLAMPDCVIYADPPYLGATRFSPSTTDYRCDMVSEEAHRRLAEVLHDTPATVLLSGYHSELYDELYGDWWQREFLVTTHSSNAKKSGRNRRVEVLWANRVLDDGRLSFSIDEQEVLA